MPRLASRDELRRGTRSTTRPLVSRAARNLRQEGGSVSLQTATTTPKSRLDTGWAGSSLRRHAQRYGRANDKLESCGQGRTTLMLWAKNLVLSAQTPPFWVGNPVRVPSKTVRNNAIPARGLSLTPGCFQSLKARRIQAALAAGCQATIAQRLPSGTTPRLPNPGEDLNTLPRKSAKGVCF